MSRTDGHEPFWVHELRYGRENHDHRHGVCDIDRAYQNLGKNLPFLSRHTCRKIIDRYTVTCLHKKNRPGEVLRSDSLHGWQNVHNIVVPCPPHCTPPWEHLGNTYQFNAPLNTYTHGVTIRIKDDSIPCICDSEENTRYTQCTIDYDPDAAGVYVIERRNNKDRQRESHGTERATERQIAQYICNEYNSGHYGDIQDVDALHAGDEATWPKTMHSWWW